MIIACRNRDTRQPNQTNCRSNCALSFKVNGSTKLRRIFLWFLSFTCAWASDGVFTVHVFFLNYFCSANSFSLVPTKWSKFDSKCAVYSQGGLLQIQSRSQQLIYYQYDCVIFGSACPIFVCQCMYIKKIKKYISIFYYIFRQRSRSITDFWAAIKIKSFKDLEL